MMSDAFHERLRELLRVLRFKEARLANELRYLCEQDFYGQQEIKILSELYQISLARRFAIEYANTK
jgi:hypothetical protein